MDLSFFFNGEGGKSILQWILLLGIFMFVVPKLYFYQMYTKIETSVLKLEKISRDGQNVLVKIGIKFGKKKKQAKDLVAHFIDFFMIPPVSLDPFGIIKKLEHLINNTEHRFRQVAQDLVPKADSEETMNVYMGLQAAVAIHTIAKIVRHYVELVKKFKNLQFAMILQMQLPLIEKLVESEYKGLNAFVKGQAIGDGAGPLVIASLLDKEGKEYTQDALVLTEWRWGRKITFVKANGPGGRLGKIGDAVEKLCKKHKIVKIITIDAASKLEGEKTGTVCEGVGVAIGGAGVERSKIEEIATKNKIPIEALTIKMSPFEAIAPMPEEITKAIKPTIELLQERVKDTRKGSHIIVVGVGNTCGIPNKKQGLKKIIKDINRRARKLKREEEEKEKGFFKKRSATRNSFLNFLYSFGAGINKKESLINEYNNLTRFTLELY